MIEKQMLNNISAMIRLLILKQILFYSRENTFANYTLLHILFLYLSLTKWL